MEMMKIPVLLVAAMIMSTIARAQMSEGTQTSAKVVYAGALPHLEIVTKSKKGATWELASLTFDGAQQTMNIKVPVEQGRWLAGILPRLNPARPLTLGDLKADYERAGLEDFELFWDNKPVNTLYKVGLLRL